MEKGEQKGVEALWGTYQVPSLHGIHGRIKFQGPAGTVVMSIDDGKVTLSPKGEPTDCTVSADEPALLLRLVAGQRNLVTTLLQGRIQVHGDAMLLVRVAGSMPELQERLEEVGRREGGGSWPANP